MAYTKLFTSILDSTIWSEPPGTKLVWITMLAMADKNGEVMASIPGLAKRAGVTLDECKVALDRFLSPDPYSRTPDDEGRRIEVIDGGWSLLNHAKYRDMASRDEQKTANAVRQKRWRDKQARNKNSPLGSNATVTLGNGTVTDVLHIADTDSKAETLSPKPSPQSPEIDPQPTHEEREGREFEPEPPPSLWKTDFSANGIPALIEKLVSAYPMNGALQMTREAIVDLVKQGEDLHEVLRKTKIISDQIRALPTHRRQRLPGKVSFYAQHRYNDDPNAFPWVHVDEPVKTEKPKSKYL